VKHIILVEDLDETRAWLEGLLKTAFDGVMVTAVSTVGKAMSALDSCTFDLAIIDLSLPDGSGIEILKKIQQTSLETVSVVATIFDDDKHLFSALRAGAQGYLLKDQPEEQLLALFKGLEYGNVPFSPSVARRILRHISHQNNERVDVDVLTEREKEVLALIAKGINRNEVARLLGISPHTVGGYTKDIYRKLKINTRAEATIEALRLGLAAL